MSFEIVTGDITAQHVGAIVNTTGPTMVDGADLLPPHAGLWTRFRFWKEHRHILPPKLGEGITGAIHRVAGPKLAVACRKLGLCPVGGIQVTEAFRLPSLYVFHTVVPERQGGKTNELDVLAKLSRSLMEAAVRQGSLSLAMPLLGAGERGYPSKDVYRVLVREISAFVRDHDLRVVLVLSPDYPPKKDADCRSLAAHFSTASGAQMDGALLWKFIRMAQCYGFDLPEPPKPTKPKPKPEPKTGTEPDTASRGDVRYCISGVGTYPLRSGRYMDPIETQRLIERMQYEMEHKPRPDSFSSVLLRMIREHRMTESECYRRANIDRRLFSKIRSNSFYQPAKTTALAFVIALKLSRKEADELLARAGFVLSDAIMADRLVAFCLENRIYDIHQVNLLLYEADQPLLGRG